MNYTLFIDESGDFENQRGEWLISGALFKGTLQDVNQTLKTKLKDFPKEINVNSIRDFHLTEFRRDFGHSVALNKAETFLLKVSKVTQGFKALAVINFAKHSLSEKEKTYRAMLRDMIALVDSAIPDNEDLTHLDLVVAKRTIDGELQTTLDDLKKDVINALPEALEYDLASLGMTGLIGKNLKVTQDYANNLWGLVCADFIANINYHRKKQNEKELINRLELSGVFTTFEAFGNHHERRAKIAERNHDFVLAIFRWIVIAEANKNIEVAENITKLLNKIYQSSGSTGAKTNLESLIEKIWRHFTKLSNYDFCIYALKLLEDCLLKSFYERYRFKPEFILFRIRNLVLLLLNHQGETVQADELLATQQTSLKSLASNPENLSVIFDFNLIELEYYINNLDLVNAKSKAEKFIERIENYHEVWSLFNEDSCDDLGFQNSGFYIKAKMASLRIFALESKSPDDKIENQFRQLENLDLGSFDRNRLNNYYTLYLLKSNQLNKAIDILAINDEKIINSSTFDLFWILNAVNSTLLDRPEICINIEKPLLERLDDQILLNLAHPNDIIWREAALYFWLRNDKSKSLRFIKRAQLIFNLRNSPVSRLIKDINVILEAIFKGKLQETVHKIEYFKFQAVDLKNERLLIQKIKHFSPY
ncbi:MAG: hypothetical protein AB7D03_06555 [Thiomicrospira sp.]